MHLYAAIGKKMEKICSLVLCVEENEQILTFDIEAI